VASVSLRAPSSTGAAKSPKSSLPPLPREYRKITDGRECGPATCDPLEICTDTTTGGYNCCGVFKCCALDEEVQSSIRAQMEMDRRTSEKAKLDGSLVGHGK
jgi:hypothetical protein